MILLHQIFQVGSLSKEGIDRITGDRIGLEAWALNGLSQGAPDDRRSVHVEFVMGKTDRKLARPQSCTGCPGGPCLFLEAFRVSSNYVLVRELPFRALQANRGAFAK